MSMPTWMSVIVYALTLTVFLGIFAWRHMDDSVGRSPFVMLVFLTALMLVTEFGHRCYIYEQAPHLTVVGCTIITFILLPSLAIEWYQYIRNVLTAEERSHMKYLDFVVNIIAGVGIVVVLLSPITSWTFSFDDAGMYNRGPLFALPAISSLLIMILTVIFIATKVSSLSLTSRMVLSAFPIAPLVGGILAIVFPGVPWIPLGVSVSVTALFAHIQNTGMGRDYLTGLFNRKKLEELMAERVGHASSGHAFGAIMMDLDSFKQVNDTLGHAVGDIALADAAHLLRRSVRSGDAVARFGGDEFFVLLEVDGRQELEEVVARIDEEERKFDQEGRPYILRLSKGYDMYDANRFETVQEFEHHLDALMYENKRLRKQQTKGPETRIDSPVEERRRV